MQVGTSSTTQGGGESFKNRKPIGEVACCESQMAEWIHWSTERWLRSPLFLSLPLSFSLFLWLPTYYLSMYLFICPSIYLSIFLSIYLSIYLSVYLPIYLSVCLSTYLSICLSIYLSFFLAFFLSFFCLSINQSIYPSIYLSPAPAISISIYEIPLLYFNRHGCSGCKGQLDQTLGRADLTLQSTVLKKNARWRVNLARWRVKCTYVCVYMLYRYVCVYI